jgi:hypothetical protein
MNAQRNHVRIENLEMSNFCSDQGRIRRRLKKGYGGTSKGFRSPHSGTGRHTSVRRSRKPAENADQDKKGHFWMDTN